MLLAQFEVVALGVGLKIDAVRTQREKNTAGSVQIHAERDYRTLIDWDKRPMPMQIQLGCPADRWADRIMLPLIKNDNYAGPV